MLFRKKIRQVADIKLELIEVMPAMVAGRPPLLFLHGAYMGAWCWSPHCLPLCASRGYRSFALSLRGHGDSEGHATLALHSINDYLNDVAWAVREVTERCGRPPVLVGHSMGGYLALAHARDVALPGLALLAPLPPEGLLGSTLHLLFQHPQLLWELHCLQYGEQPLLADKLRELLFSPAMDLPTLLGYAARFQHESQRALLDLSVPQFDLRPPKGMPPALVLGSRADKIIPPHLVHSAARALGVRARMLDGVGHAMMLDAPWRQVADEFLQWLETLP
ncbi:alpha/beta hydrolase [Chitinimonas sp. BJYL2]|uniref:alpha/beta hydrolase n=1 Tax=Chitinimonas sp. BJYL2 TaxID=2976696 RepID=UPI0022B33443|nr:alpha/beta hydrolase [Chitinimonas sp. BJYL2]